VNDGLGFVLSSFTFSFFVPLFSDFFILDLDKGYVMTSYVTVTQVIKSDGSVTLVTVTVTQSCDIKKDIEDSEIDNIIQHKNNMLVL